MGSASRNEIRQPAILRRRQPPLSSFSLEPPSNPQTQLDFSTNTQTPQRTERIFRQPAKPIGGMDDHMVEKIIAI
jgi:hypothetical protein